MGASNIEDLNTGKLGGYLEDQDYLDGETEELISNLDDVLREKRILLQSLPELAAKLELAEKQRENGFSSALDNKLEEVREGLDQPIYERWRELTEEEEEIYEELCARNPEEQIQSGLDEFKY